MVSCTPARFGSPASICADRPPSAPPGVDLRPLAELDPRKVYELDPEAMLDVPGEVAMDDLSFEQWLEDYWRHPGTDIDASVAAVIDDRPRGGLAVPT